MKNVKDKVHYDVADIFENCSADIVVSSGLVSIYKCKDFFTARFPYVQSRQLIEPFLESDKWFL